MRWLDGITFLVSWCIGNLACGADALPAFPGAEGFGTQTPGGRGGRVIEVIHLEDAGPGSLRAAVAAEGPRTVADPRHPD